MLFIYKHITIVNDDFCVVSKWLESLIDDARGIIYDRKMFLKQAMIDLPLFFSSGGYSLFLLLIHWA